MAVQSNGEKLKAITQNSVTVNVFMTTMTTDIHKDSKFLKLLIFITLLYMLASFMVVHLVDCDTEAEGSQLIWLIRQFSVPT